MSSEFKSDLEAVKNALSHKAVLHECIRVTLAVCEKRRRGAGKKKTAKEPPPGSRYNPTAMCDQVWERDQGQCAFVGSDGKRCSSRHQLEVHHRDPFGMGGATSVDKLALFCRAHNGYAARQDYGATFMARKIASSRAKETSSPYGSGRAMMIG